MCLESSCLAAALILQPSGASAILQSGILVNDFNILLPYWRSFLCKVRKTGIECLYRPLLAGGSPPGPGRDCRPLIGRFDYGRRLHGMEMAPQPIEKIDSAPEDGAPPRGLSGEAKVSAARSSPAAEHGLLELSIGNVGIEANPLKNRVWRLDFLPSGLDFLPLGLDFLPAGWARTPFAPTQERGALQEDAIPARRGRGHPAGRSDSFWRLSH